MPESANVRSIDALYYFQAAVVKFQEEARLCVSSLEMQLLRMIGWLERDRPGFWKREIEVCYREMGEAKIRLHQCRMRRMGDFRPTCFEEQKALEKARKDIEFAQKQIPVVKYWSVCAHREANEYHGRASQLTQMIERELPRLLAMLRQVIDRLEAYSNVQVPGASAPQIETSSGRSETHTQPADAVADAPAAADQPDKVDSDDGLSAPEIDLEQGPLNEKR